MSSSSPPRSPHRSRAEHSNAGEERPRFFDKMVKNLCWTKAKVVPGRLPERWREDTAGNIVCKRFCNCHGCLCFEYDHIILFSKGGEPTKDNCQILQTRVNRFKSDKQVNDATALKGYSCDVKFTGGLIAARYHPVHADRYILVQHCWNRSSRGLWPVGHSLNDDKLGQWILPPTK